MKHYSQKRKDAVLKRMMQPENAPAPMLAEETGISKVTGTPDRLYDWRKHAIAKGLVSRHQGLDFAEERLAESRKGHW
jgi:transposase